MGKDTILQLKGMEGICKTLKTTSTWHAGEKMSTDASGQGFDKWKGYNLNMKGGFSLERPLSSSIS